MVRTASHSPFCKREGIFSILARDVCRSDRRDSLEAPPAAMAREGLIVEIPTKLRNVGAIFEDVAKNPRRLESKDAEKLFLEVLSMLI